MIALHNINTVRENSQWYNFSHNIHIVIESLLLPGMLMPKLLNAHFFEFPKPTGKYTVGVTSIHLTDQRRHETYCPDTNMARQLMLTAWYPTGSAQDTLSAYAPDYLINSIKELVKPFKEVTPDDIDQLNSIRVHALQDAPIIGDKGTLPLIIFSHGYFGSRYYCSALCQELASHGYIVVAPDHTYDCGITQFSDGTTLAWKSLTDAPFKSDEFYATFKTRLKSALMTYSLSSTQLTTKATLFLNVLT